MTEIANNPTVSVIIPTYNRVHFLGETIQSVLNQTYRDFELIIADDGSTDNTEQLVKSFGSDRIKYIQLKKNSGSSAVPRNTGLKAATGKYIALLDSDDTWLPDKLKLEVNFLDTHPSIGLVYSDYTYFGSRGSSEKTGFESKLPVSGFVLKEMFLNNPIISDTVLVRKLCFEKVGLFDESIVQCGDLDMWLRIAVCFEIGYVDVPLARYRLHEKNRHLETGNSLIGEITTRKKCLESSPFLLDEIAPEMMYQKYYRHYQALGNWYLNIGIPLKAREPFWKYLRLYPYDPVAYVSWLITFLPPCLVSWIRTCKRKLGVNI